MIKEIIRATIEASDVAKYFLYRSIEDGELISPLKMQKLVYYAYSWTLVKNSIKLFDEQIEAWPNGPVVPSLYHQLKQYGSSPIGDNFLSFRNEKDLADLKSKFKDGLKETLDMVYQEYMTKTAFELVVLTHSEEPWQNARKGLSATEPSNNAISDSAILDQYGKE